MTDTKYGLSHSEEVRKGHKYPERYFYRGHWYQYLGATEYKTHSGAEGVAKKLRKEGWSAFVYATNVGVARGVYGIYVRARK